MKIVVCVNHVPDTATKVNISSDQKTIDPTGVTYVLNPYDEFAIEEALKTKEAIGGEVIAISLGSETNKEVVNKTGQITKVEYIQRITITYNFWSF